MKNRADAVFDPEYKLSTDVVGFGGEKGTKYHVKYVPESVNAFEIHHEGCCGCAASVGESLSKCCSTRPFRDAMRRRCRTAVSSRENLPAVNAPRVTWVNSPSKVGFFCTQG